jgi:hypothetical protein
VAGLVVVAGTTTVFDASSAVFGSAPPTETLTCNDNWTGGGPTGDWDSAANWTGGVPDGDGVDACITGSAAVTLSDASSSVGELTVSPGSSLTIGTDAATAPSGSTGPPTVAPGLTVRSGLDNGGSLTVGTTGMSGHPALTLGGPVTNSGTITVTGTLDVGDGTPTAVSNDGTIGVGPGGMVSMDGTAAITNEPDGLLAFGINGPPGAAAASGQISGGTLALGGSADPVFENGFIPPADAEYVVDTGPSSGTFATVLGGASAVDGPTGEVGLSGGAPAIATATRVTSSVPTASFFGQALQLTATVSPSSGTDPTGSVAFSSGDLLVARAPLTTDTAGVTTATVTVSDLPVGTTPITAAYSGDVLFGASTSPVLAQGVNPDTTDLTITPNVASPEAGQPVTYTATVSRPSSNPGAPTGTISFTDDGSPVATCQSVELSDVAPFRASCTETFEAGASHDIVATYSGDTDDAGSTASLLQTLGQIPTQIAVTSTTPNLVYGQSAVVVATITPAVSAAASPGGSITFFDGTTPLGTGAVSTVGGVASANLEAAGLVEGPHFLTATYSGDPTYATSTSVTPFVIDTAEAATTVTVTSASVMSVVGQTVVFTASIDSSTPGETGTIQFDDDGSLIGIGAVSGGQATFETSSLALGTHPITAIYEGDDNFVGGSSANTITEAITPAPTSTVVTSAHNPGLVGQDVAYTASVSVSTPGSGAPTGSVSFSDDGSPIATCQGLALPTESPLVVTCSQSYDTTATQNVTATYGGDASFTSSVGTMAENVAPVSTTTALVSSPSASTSGQSVTLTATVAPTSGAANPDGTVSFALDGTPLGNSVLSTTDDVSSASMLLTTLPIGSDAVTASYDGGAGFLPSSSAAASVTVTRAATTIDVLASANLSTAGQPVSLTATVFPTTGSGETGRVTFFENDVAIGTGSVSNGQATLTVFSQLSDGAAITAVYSGDSNFLGSTTTAPLRPTVL